MKHAVIVPVYNEANYIEGLLDSLVNQTLPPERIIIVNDNSTDRSAEIVSRWATEFPSIQLVRGGPNEGRSYRVVEVFNYGYAAIDPNQFDYISKLDADMILPPEYFEVLFRKMDEDETIGAGSGVVDEIIGGKRVRFRLPENHVPGMLKTFRRSVFEQMGGFLPVIGWDIIDLVAVRRLGYRTISLPELPTLHRRRHASATGILRGNVRMGRGAYIIGTHPIFMIGRAFYRMLEPPYLLGGAALWWGYVQSWLRKVERISDRDLIEALREEQMYRLFHRNRLRYTTPLRDRRFAE